MNIYINTYYVYLHAYVYINNMYVNVDLCCAVVVFVKIYIFFII